MNKKITFTFDYEPFLFKTGDIEKTLINPTTELLEKLRSNGIEGTFFIDTFFLSRILEDLGSKSELWAKVSAQIFQIHNLGHEIGLHLHPHWIDAKFHNTEWNLSNVKKYRIHSLSKDEIDNIIKKSIDIIHNITKDKIWSQQISFRAGGWAIQPFSYLSDIFTKYNILIDSSVSKGVSNNKKPFNYDFEKIQMQCAYKFLEDVTIEHKSGKFLEVPITSYSYTFIMKLISRLDKYLRSEIYETYGIGESVKSSEFRGNKVYKYFKTDRMMLSIDRMKPTMFKQLLKSIDESNIVIISHPKDYSQSSGICLDLVSKISYFKFVKLMDVDKFK
jgi:peptidoglycan/xylan/chitin deacetylase (PgdA/CDA1 family)